MKTKKRSEWMKGILYSEECNKNNKPITFTCFESVDFILGTIDYEEHLIKDKNNMVY